MSEFKTFQVFPAIPEPIAFLEVLSRNMWWCWQHNAIELFRRINPRLWRDAGRNPITFLTMLPQERLEEIAEDESFLAHQERVKDHFERLVKAPVDRSGSAYGQTDTVVYLSMEFGIHESLPLFAGGLGVLAGDHLKAASDIGLPMVGVGLLYQHGYFRQYLDTDGWQQEEYPETDLYTLPLERALDTSGQEFQVSLAGPDGEVRAQVWTVQVGHVPLFLLDTNVPENPPGVRQITSRLYAGDQNTRLAQEVVLGIGGMKALAAMGITPTVCHMNEGHSAFAGLERIAQIMETYGVDREIALAIVYRTTVFTTHTPVDAGHEEFPAYIVKPYLKTLRERLGATENEILAWGQAAGSGPDAPLSMSMLALRMAKDCNGVSELHGAVARRMWAHVWPKRPGDEVPITHVTNGVHPPSWISPGNRTLFDRFLGPEWHLHPTDPDIVARIDDIYDEELWRAHELSRSSLIRHCRDQLVTQYGQRNAPKSMMLDVSTALDQDILTVGFARRYATYKRANLLLRDPERLEALLTSKETPIQFLFAGKAHPANREGKELIQQLVHFCRRPNVRSRIVFLEDYDILMARYLVQGCDVWLNTPTRPLEACGTSGMKSALNGVLNVSILDGWWCEGYAEDRGWAIGHGEEHSDPGYQDTVDSRALYNVLENDVVPCFYDRKDGNPPVRWLKMMKESMKVWWVCRLCWS